MKRSDLMADLDLLIKTYAKEFINKASAEITFLAQCAIQDYYSSYRPIYYDRTDDLKNNSYEPYKKNNGKKMYGGVRISDNHMQPYKLSKDKTLPAIEVVHEAWLHGRHGLSWYKGQPIFTYSPISELQIEVGSKKFKQKIIDYAWNKAVNQNFKCITDIVKR